MSEPSSRLISLSKKLSHASCERQMSILGDHPWDEPKSDQLWLRAPEKLSLHGTPYFQLATEGELRRLSTLELASWWHGFIVFERLVTEYYMRLINQGVFAEFPEVVDYMHHFCREELNHCLVFDKAMQHFGVPTFEVPDAMTDFYVDNADSGKYPLVSVYLTLLIEWIADLYQRMDTDGKGVSRLASTIVKEHTREEARHIAWAQEMIRTLARDVPEFLESARQFTPVFVRQFVDAGVANVECYQRVEFKAPAFRDVETLVAQVIDNPHRRQLNRSLLRPVMRFFVEVGIYDDAYSELWQSANFAEDIRVAKQALSR
ncbi:MAG: diiron oxygenase [Deltaproteobacteria bacterium]